MDTAQQARQKVIDILLKYTGAKAIRWNSTELGLFWVRMLVFHVELSEVGETVRLRLSKTIGPTKPTGVIESMEFPDLLVLWEQVAATVEVGPS